MTIPLVQKKNLDNSKNDPSVDDIKTQQKLKKPQSDDTRNLWRPFKTRSEFEFAEVAINASLTKKQVDALIQLMQRCIRGEDSFNIRDYDHLRKIWNSGADLYTTTTTF